eukprot:6462585-Amphidinium_carterae.2
MLSIQNSWGRRHDPASKVICAPSHDLEQWHGGETVYKLLTTTLKCSSGRRSCSYCKLRHTTRLLDIFVSFRAAAAAAATTMTTTSKQTNKQTTTRAATTTNIKDGSPIVWCS